MESKDTAPLAETPEEELFEFGDQTICRMRRQPFDPAGNPINPDELGPMVIRPLRPAVVPVEREDAASDVSTITVRPHAARNTPAADDRLARLEAKVDALTAAVEALQKTLNAIQEAVAPTVNAES